MSCWLQYKIPCATALDGIRIKALKILVPEHSTSTIHGSSGYCRAMVAHPVPLRYLLITKLQTIILATRLILTTIFIRLQHRTTITLSP